MTEPAAQTYRVGYAVEPKKVRNLVLPSLVDYAKQHGIDLVQIDIQKPLIEQGPFDCLVHKLNSEDWKRQLNEYSVTNPNVVVIDRPEFIEKLYNRVSMLDAVTQLEIPLEKETIQIPKQVVVDESKAFDVENAVEELGLKFPVIAKPLSVDGSAGSHNLCLVFDHDGLKTLNPPILLQQFVNHGGVLFKVYVAGQEVDCVTRKSLPDISEEKLRTLGGTMPFSLISNARVKENGNHHDQENGHKEEEEDSVLSNIEKAEMPPQSLIKELGKALRVAVGVNLFNVDLIRDGRDPRRYYIVDINYCPGFVKMPSYEKFFTNFLLDVVHKKTEYRKGLIKDNVSITLTDDVVDEEEEVSGSNPIVSK